MPDLLTANKPCLEETNLAIYCFHSFIHSFNSFICGTTSHTKKLLKFLARKRAAFTHPMFFQTAWESNIVALFDLASSTTKNKVLCPKEGGGGLTDASFEI